jgi:PHD/YefM family antitoxin component YafN of YafNO toxin-antitoxin module
MRRAETLTVSAAEFHKNVGRYQDMALTRPVAIRENGRKRTVLISAREYERLKQRDREVVLPGELTDREIRAIRKAKVPRKYDYLNKELEDHKP